MINSSNFELVFHPLDLEVSDLLDEDDTTVAFTRFSTFVHPVIGLKNSQPTIIRPNAEYRTAFVFTLLGVSPGRSSASTTGSVGVGPNLS